MEDNNNNIIDGQLQIRSYLYRCLYFCPTSYKFYRKAETVEHIFAKFKGPEASFMCQKCFENIKGYMPEDKSFFFLMRLKKCLYNILSQWEKKKAMVAI